MVKSTVATAAIPTTGQNFAEPVWGQVAIAGLMSQMATAKKTKITTTAITRPAIGRLLIEEPLVWMTSVPSSGIC